MREILILILFSLSCRLSAAHTFNSADSDCSEYNLEVGIELGYLPTERKQQGSGWCYAFVAADLLSHKLRTPISAVDIAVNYINRGHLTGTQMNINGQAENIYPLGGGLVDAALLSLNGRGVCLESDLTFQISPKRQPAENLSHHFNSEQWLHIKSRLQEVYRDPTSQKFSRALMSLATQKKCTPTFKEINFSVMTKTRQNQAEPFVFEKALNAALTRHRMIAIEYNSAALSHTTSAVWTQADHASALIGRRFNKEKKRCEYLLRNNEKSCAEYSKDFECISSYNHLWVPREVLLRSVSSFTYLN